jgi:hypothetical protein
MDVSGNRDVEGQNIITYRKHNGLNQRFALLYLDQKKAEPTSGLDDDTGFYRNRPFYIVSRLPKRRVLEVVGGKPCHQDKTLQETITTLLLRSFDKDHQV